MNYFSFVISGLFETATLDEYWIANLGDGSSLWANVNETNEEGGWTLTHATISVDGTWNQRTASDCFRGYAVEYLGTPFFFKDFKICNEVHPQLYSPTCLIPTHSSPILYLGPIRSNPNQYGTSNILKILFSKFR